MHTTEDFDTFVAIVDAGSISEAARALGTPRATLSRQLARLEERLGVRLLHRTTRRLVPTPAGEALLPRARSLMDAADAAVAAVQRLDDVPRGLLRISAAAAYSPVLGELISEFLLAYPEVRVELSSSSAHVDLVADQIDIALRGGVVTDPNVIARPIVRTELAACASPDYLSRRGRPASPEDLHGHACLLGFAGGSRPATSWPLRTGGAVSVAGPLVSSDLMTLRGAALGHLGIAVLPRGFVRDDLDTGRLELVLDGVVGRDVSLSLVWVEREFLLPKVRAFVDRVVAWADQGRFDTFR